MNQFVSSEQMKESVAKAKLIESVKKEAFDEGYKSVFYQIYYAQGQKQATIDLANAKKNFESNQGIEI